MAMELVSATSKEDFGFFKDGIEFDINDPGRHNDSWLTFLLDSGGLARFEIPNDALHLRRKTDNKETLDIIANSAHVIFSSSNKPAKNIFLTRILHFQLGEGSNRLPNNLSYSFLYRYIFFCLSYSY